MSEPPQDPQPRRGRKVRVDFRRNRSPRVRKKDWTGDAHASDDREVDSQRGESIAPKGALSRKRTIIEHDEPNLSDDSKTGLVLAVRGLYVEVDDGAAVIPCTIRRVLRTRVIGDRSPVTVGDVVTFRVQSSSQTDSPEGVILDVAPRTSQLRRHVGRRIQTIAANVDQAIIVASAAQPHPRPGLIDRYIVAALHGGVRPVVVINKIDLDEGDQAVAILERYADLGYGTMAVSALKGTCVDELRETLHDRVSVVAGQSGVGKSALLNAVEPGLTLRTGAVTRETGKGRHTTTTAVMLRLSLGGYVVDTPGIRSFDLSIVPRNEFEMFFEEFVEFVPNCKFPDCTHTHETGCAVVEALDRGDIHPDRYDSYVRLFNDDSIGFD